eukprot:SAG31_NODE_2241_length_6110_cov_3.386292_2_plen_151_part_00
MAFGNLRHVDPASGTDRRFFLRTSMAMPALLTNSGAASIKQTCSIPYESFVAAGLRSDQTIVTQVRKDLPRTFPLHPRFAVSANPGQDGSIAVVGADSDSLIGALERVLLALCAWQPQTGYTQVSFRSLSQHVCCRSTDSGHLCNRTTRA